MANYTTYSEFLNQAYRKILAACLQDEAIDTLRILENKDYLLLRINELFSQIYLAERERKIEQQASLISSLLKQHNGVKSGSKSAACNNCQMAQQNIESLTQQRKELQRRVAELSSNEERSTKRIESLLLKENEEMKREIKKMQAQILSVSEEFETQKQILSRQNHRLKLKLKEEIEKAEQSLGQLKSTIARNLQEKEKLEKTVFEFLEKQGRQEKDIREMNAKLNNANSLKERHQTQISQIRNENNILQQKVSRLEEENGFVKDKNSSLQKEVKTLKKHIDQLESELLNPNLSSKQKTENKGQNDWSIQLLGKLNQSQKRNIELQKHINTLKHQLATKEKEFNEASLHQEKTIIKTNEEMKKLQHKYDKQLRNSKQQYKRLIATNSEDIQQAKIQQKIDIIKRYDSIVSQKERLLMKREEEILALNRTLAETQRNLTDFTTSHEEQRQLLQQQLKNERQNLKELRKHYASELCEEKQVEKEFKDKQRQLLEEKEEQKRMIISKDKQIKEYKRQLMQINEKIVASELKYEEYRDKYDNISKTIDGYLGQINGLKDQLKEKEKRLKESLKKNAQWNEQRDELQGKMLTLSKNQKRLEEKIKRLEAEVIEKREALLGIHQHNKQELIDVYQRTQQVTAQTRKQLENYYMNLLRSNEERKIHEEVDQLQRNQKEEFKELKYIAEEYEEKCYKYKQKYIQQVKQKEIYQQKVNAVCDQIQALKKENSKAIDLVREEKKRNLSMMKAYQDKMLEYYNHFNEFKREFYLNIREQLHKLKNQLKSIAQYMEYQAQKFKEYLGQTAKKTTQQIQLVNTNCQLRIDKIRHEYEYGVVLKLEQEKRQIQLISQMKVKEQAMEFYTIMAEKQHQINLLVEKEGRITKKFDEIESKYESTVKINQQGNRKLQELKEIIAKMNQKVTQAERTATNSSSEADYYRRENIQLKKQINMLETTFKQKIEKCKELYTAQNEKIFVRYNNELTKFVGSNKKSMDFLLQSDIVNSHIPTKGAKECEKYDQIKKEIEEQKKKLKMLQQDCQPKGKVDKTTKISCERDVVRVERMRRS